MATELASAYLTLIPSLSGAQKKIEAQLSGIDVSKPGKNIGSSLASGLGGGLKALAKIGVGAIATVGAAVGGLAVGGGVSRALKLDQATFKFKALGMDVQSAMESCNEAVMGTAFGLDAAATVATQLGAAGVSAGGAMTGALKSVAGVAAMSSSSMEDIGAIFSKVAAKGKVGGDELLQLTERGINATAALGSYLGKTADDVSKMVSRGEIDFATFSAAMQATFGEAASGANATFQGAMSNVAAALSRVGAKFASPALDSLRRVFVALIPAIDAVSKILDPAVRAFTNFANAISGRMVSGINEFIDVLKESDSVATAIAYGLESTFKCTVLGGIFASIADSVDTFVQAMRSGEGVFKAFGSTVSSFSAGMKTWITTAFDGSPIGTFISWVSGCFSLFSLGDTPVDGFRLVLANLKNTIVGIASSDGVAVFVDNVKAKIAELPQPFQDVIGKVSGFVSAISEKFSGVTAATGIAVGAFAVIMAKFSGPIKSIAGVAGKVGPLLDLVGGAVVSLGLNFAEAGGGIRGLVKVLGMIVSPAGLIVAAIAAVAAAFVGLMSTNEQFRETVMGLVGAIGASLAPILSVIGQALSNLAMTVLPMIGSVIQMLMPVMMQIFTVLLQLAAALAPVITMLVATVVPIITQIIQLVVMVAAQVLTAIMPVISAVLAMIQTAMPQIQAIITAVMAVVVGIIQAAWPVIQMVIEAAMSVIQAVIDNVWPVIQTVIETVMGAVQNVINIVLAAINGDWEGVWNGIKDLFSDIWEGIQEAASQGVDAVMNIVTGIKDNILGFFDGAGSWLLDAGESILRGLWDGISGALGWLGDQLAGIGDFIINHKGPKSYDLKMLIPNGGWIMQSLSFGIERGMPGLERTLSSVVGSIEGFASSIEPFDSVDVGIRLERSSITSYGIGENGAKKVEQTFVFNQPVKSPDEVARLMRMHARYGLAAEV